MYSTVDFVTGKAEIDPKDVSPAEWVAIVRSAIGKMPAGYMRGFESMKQILGEKQHGGVERHVEWRPTNLLPACLRPHSNSVFLNCLGITGDFPSGDGLMQQWQKAPRRTGEQGLSDDLLHLSTEHLLLSRKSVLYYVKISWVPVVKWDEYVEHLETFRYEANLDTVSLEVLQDDERLQDLFTRKLDAPKQLLSKLYLALRLSVGDAQHRYHLFMEKEHELGGYLDRLGLLYK